MLGLNLKVRAVIVAITLLHDEPARFDNYLLECGFSGSRQFAVAISRWKVVERHGNWIEDVNL